MNILLELNENKNTAQQNLWDTLRAVLWGKFIAYLPTLKKSERAEINDLIIQLKIVKKQEQSKSQNTTWQEIIKIKIKLMK